MPSARELLVVLILGTIAVFGAFLLFDLSGPVAVVVASAVSLNFWVIRGLLRARTSRQRDESRPQ